MKDPTAWREDVTFYMGDDSVAETAATIEPTLLYGGSKAAAGAWIGLSGILGGVLGGVTLSPAIRQPITFVGFLVGAALLLRGFHPLTVRLLGRAVGWLSMLAFFWAALLGFFAVLGARIDSRVIPYAVSLVCRAFIGLMYGALPPGVTKNENLWMTVSLPLAPLSSVLSTYVLRHTPGGIDALGGAAWAGALAGGLFAVPMGTLLGRIWDEAQGLAEMGLLYLHNDHFAPKAVAYFDRAIALNPGDARYYNFRAVGLSRMNEHERASADWDKASALAPGDPEPHLNRGIDHLRREAVSEAIRCFESALEKHPERGKPHRYLGAAYERHGDLKRAFEHYDRAIVLAPDDARAHADRGSAALRKGDYEQALRDSERAIRLESQLSAAWVTRGHALAMLGRPDEALDSFREAIDLDPEPSLRQDALRGLESCRGAVAHGERQ